jgi:hypothetical protein
MPKKQLPPNVIVTILTSGTKSSIHKPGRAPPKITNTPPTSRPVIPAVRVSPKVLSIKQLPYYVLVDQNGFEHPVAIVDIYRNPREARACFPHAVGRHTLVDPSKLKPAPADLDLSGVKKWWETSARPGNRQDKGTLYFPPPPQGFRPDDYVTVVIPDEPPLPGLVDEVIRSQVSGEIQYRVIYSKDSNYNTGQLHASEVTGPAFTFNPATDFQHPASHVSRNSPVSPPLFTEEDGTVDRPLTPVFADGGFIGPPPQGDPAFSTPARQYVLFSNRRHLRQPPEDEIYPLHLRDEDIERLTCREEF